MKRLAVITTSLLLTLSAFGGAAVALAEGENQTNYPENGQFIKPLVFTDLKDYEIVGDTYYFLDGETYLKYENGERTEIEYDGEFSPSLTEVSVDNCTFKLLETMIKVADFDGEEFATFEGNYSNLKKFGNKGYAIKDNVLYSFDSKQEPKAVSLEYVDYAEADKIPVGQTTEALKNYGQLTFVTVKEGAYMTKVDLTALGGEYFVSDENGGVETIKSEKDRDALLLCYTGNAAIIAIGDTSYILQNDPSAIQEKTINCKSEAEFPTATIVGNRIYATPFTVTGTTALPNATGTIVTVKNKIDCPGVLNSVYYEVEYTAQDGTVKTGYVAYGHLTEYIIEDNKPPEVKPDPNHSESTRVTTVLLVLAVVILVLAAVGYVVYTATSNNKRTASAVADGTESGVDSAKPKKEKKSKKK